MKKFPKKWLLLAALMLAVLLTLGTRMLRQDLPGWELPETLTWGQRRELKRTVLEAAERCRAFYRPEPARADIDNMEAGLIEAGYPVVDTDGIYPAYLRNPESLRQFWAEREEGKNTRVSLLRVSEDGGLSLTYFLREKGEDRCVFLRIRWEDGEPFVWEQEHLPVYDMELTDWDCFYYSLYPKDPHYIDYMQIPLTAPDRERYDLSRTYIIPIGYQMVNFFLVDWQEGKWGDMSFNDVFEYFYKLDTGLPQFSWVDYADPNNPNRARIPAKLFEDTLLPRFRISREELRALAGYDEDRGGYPWRTFFGDDLTTWSYSMCEPQVTAVTENGDGTVTLAIDVASPENKTNRQFSHEVVIRPMADGGVQYVSNRMTYVGEWGLPYCQNRFALDGGAKSQE